MSLPSKPIEKKPELLELLKKTKDHVMTAEEWAAQRKSWVIGNFMLDHPDATREHAEEIYAKVTRHIGVVNVTD